MHSLSKRGLYHDVFQRAKIKTAIVQDTDSGIILKPNDPPDLIQQVLRTGELFWIRSKEDLDLVSLSIGYGTVHSLNEWLDVCGLVFERGKAAVGIKLPIAYISSLKSSRPTFSEAEQVFNHFVRKRELFALGESINWEEATPLRDYLIHQVIRLATKYHLPIQIHTGLLENTYNDVRDSDPLHLIPLFL